MRQSRGTEADVEERRQLVLRQVVEEGEVRIGDLAERLGVSLMTMHRDLDNLYERGLVRKRRGVAAAFPTLTMERALRFRENVNIAEKTAIAGALVEEVRPGSTVLVDCGSTLFPLARRLGEIEGLQVITNSLRVAYLLSGSDTEVTLLGDRFHSDFESCAGPETLRQLERIRADVAFITATSISGGRLYHPVREYADNKEAYQRAADRTVLAVDHTKFGRTATCAYGDVGGFDLVVTDEAAPEEEIRAIEDLGVPVRTVPRAE